MIGSASRAFSFRPWALTVCSTVAVFEFLTMFAWRTETGRPFDVAIALIAIPVGAFALIAFAALLLALLARTPLTASLNAIVRLLPLAWSIPLVDLIRSYGNGVAVSSPSFGGSGFIIASFSGGLLPLENGIPVGARFGIFAVALILAIATWHARSSFVRAGIAFFAWSAIAVHLAASLAAFVFWRNPFAVGAWSAVPHEVSRRIVTALSQGYWWNGVYERFVTSIASQPEVAGRFAIAAACLIALGIFLLAFFFILADRRARIFVHAFRSWGAFDLALYVVVGVGGARWAHALPATGGACVPAIALFILMLVALRFGAVMKRDLFRLSVDERNGVDQPVASGRLSPENARAFADISTVFVFSAAFVLGWSVFVSVLAYLAASRLTRERLSDMLAWSSAVYRAIGAGALAFAAFAFASQGATVTLLAFSLTAIAAAHRLFVELFWIPRVAVTRRPPDTQDRIGGVPMRS